MLNRLFVLTFIIIGALCHPATANGWSVVDMKQDWKEVLPPVSTIGTAKETKP
jgi:hypothetical protein